MEEDYKERIIEMISKVDSKSALRYIYAVISTYLKSRGI
jgi:hypothetical protein